MQRREQEVGRVRIQLEALHGLFVHTSWAPLPLGALANPLQYCYITKEAEEGL